jgi:alpha-1,2-mannosyltransferase
VARPFLDEFLYAQANVVVLWLVVAATAAEDAGEDLRGGLLVGLATGLKLTPALFLVDFLLRRRWRALAGAAAAGALLAAAPVVTYGVAGAVGVHREWFRSLRHSAPALVGSYMNQGVFGIVAHATQDRLDGPIPPGPATWLALALAGAVVVVALAARYPQPRRGMLLVAMAAAGPLGWIWNFVYAWPLLAWLAARGPRARLAVAAAGLALCIPIYDIAGPRIEDWVFGHSLPGLVMLGFLGAAAWASAHRDAPGAEA